MGNSPFGIGWTLSGLAPISLDIQEKLPHCGGHDGYVFEGDELVPALNSQGEPHIEEHNEYWGHTYRSRIEQTFTRLERWMHKTTGRIHWRSWDGAITLVYMAGTPLTTAVSRILTTQTTLSPGCRSAIYRRWKRALYRICARES